MVLAVAVFVHIGTIVYAVRCGLGAAEIVGRVQGNGAWLAFYVVFVAAAAVHAPIGLRTVLTEMTPLPGRAAGVVALAVAAVIAWMGLSAAFGLYGAG
jgi:fumarate reductase subunit C